MAMIIDCFTFFNELDLLKVRMNVLAPYVDAFVLSEANRTFQGDPKLYLFPPGGPISENVFGSGKPLYVVRVDLSGFDGQDYSPWVREAAQRQSMAAMVMHLAKHDRDRIILSDVDEIPNLEPFAIYPPDLWNVDPIIAWKQDLYYYWVNLRCWKWVGPVSCTWGRLRSQFGCDLQAFRNLRHLAPTTIDGGWHFSFLGGAEAIKAKIEAFSHTEYRHLANDQNIREALTERWKENVDLFGRELTGMKFELMPDDSHLPAYLRENKEQFRGWWYQ